MKQAIRKYPILTALIMLAAGYGLVREIPVSSIEQQILVRVAAAALMFFAIYLAAGKQPFVWKKGSFWEAFYLCRSFLIITFVLALLALVAGLQEEISPLWKRTAALTFVECIFVGLFEEGLFRGVLLESFLVRLGKSKRGLIGAVLLSSFIFGYMHVIEFTWLAFGSADVALQMFSKTLITMMSGCVFAAAYLKTKNLYAAAAVHGLTDFMLLFVNALSGEMFESVYVTVSDTEAFVGKDLLQILVFTLLYAWPFIHSINIIQKLPIPRKSIWLRTDA